MDQKLALRISILVILSSVFGYLLFNWVMSAALHSRGEVIVPDIAGKSLFDAISLVSSFNLGLKMEGEEFDQDLPAGTIIRQSPYPGITVREGKIIKVTVSQGGEVIFVPDIVKQPVRSARITLRSSGLSLGEEESKYSIVIEKGYVISQDPKPGSIVEKDSLVNLLISAGPPTEDIILMPDWIGMNIDDARLWAEKKQIALEISEENVEGMVSGTIMRQQPIPDSEISREQVIKFVIASPTGEEVFIGKRFYYELPASGGQRQVRLTLLDDNGEKEIFNGVRPSGTKLEVPINPQGSARIRIFINNVLVEEREVE